jgi:hypothetical protein
MAWAWTLLGLAVIAISFFLWRHQRAPSVNKDLCPYKIGTDKIDCGEPCEIEPPCHHV